MPDKTRVGWTLDQLLGELRRFEPVLRRAGWTWGNEIAFAMGAARDKVEELAGEVERRTEVLNDAIRWLSTFRPVGGRYTVQELEDFDARLDALKVRRSAGEGT